MRVNMTSNPPTDQTTDRLRNFRRSKTITVTDCSKGDGRKAAEVSFVESDLEAQTSSPPIRPTTSCQALRHAVSSLTRIDDFLLEELGHGFFANVYKATHKVTGEIMVMKINKDSENRPNALREVQLMNKLSHPNILRFLGVCVHEGQLHALSEFISGGTLEALLMDLTEELPWTLRIKLSLDVARGMRYLHLEGVFHRDLNSKNVLIKKRDNKHYQAILADFGLATKIPDPNHPEPLYSVGCPWWMAPEVIEPKPNGYDERADFFSFGIICLEITARIDADPDIMPRTQKFGVDYVLFVEMVDYCPLDYLQLAFKCCQVLPQNRPSSNAIINTLEEIYKSLKTNSISNSAKLHKRSRSEDNIISGDSYEEDFIMTPQIIAQAMSKDDPHYSPADVNPFHAISKFRGGQKVFEFPRQRKGSTGSSGSGSSYKSDHFNMSNYGASRKNQAGELHKSQSLPCSPEMLRRAAEKRHQASLHGSDAVVEDGHESFNSFLSVNDQSIKEPDKVASAPDRSIVFGTSRTRSLGALDFWSPQKAYQQRKEGVCHSEKLTLDKEIAESSIEDQLSCEGIGDQPDLLDDDDDHSMPFEYEANNNHSSTTLFESCYSELSSVPPSDLSPCSDASWLSEDPWGESRQGLSPSEDRPTIAEQSASFDRNHFGKPASNGHISSGVL